MGKKKSSAIKPSISYLINIKQEESDSTELGLGYNLTINENLEYEESELPDLSSTKLSKEMAMHLAVIAIFVSIPIITMENKPIIVVPNIVGYNQYGE